MKWLESKTKEPTNAFICWLYWLQTNVIIDIPIGNYEKANQCKGLLENRGGPPVILNSIFFRQKRIWILGGNEDGHSSAGKKTILIQAKKGGGRNLC